MYRAWLDGEGAFDPAAGGEAREEAARRIGLLFDRTWEAVRRALFVRDCVFNDCSTFPVGLGQALWLAEEKNSLKDWLPEKAGALDPTAENTLFILDEKEEALRIVRDLRRLAEAPFPALTETFRSDLAERFETFELYVRGFKALVSLFALVRLAERDPAAVLLGRPVAEAFAEALAEADGTIADYHRFYRATALPSAVYQLVNAERLACFRDDAAASFAVLGRL